MAKYLLEVRKFEKHFKNLEIKYLAGTTLWLTTSPSSGCQTTLSHKTSFWSIFWHHQLAPTPMQLPRTLNAHMIGLNPSSSTLPKASSPTDGLSATSFSNE